jgi:HK97 gp10 family phage protein
MAGTIDMELQGVREAMGKVRAWEKEKKEAVEKAIAKTATNIERKGKRNAPVDTGRLRASIEVVDVNVPLTKAIRAGNANVRYAAAVEYGAKAHYAPIEPLKAWAKRVLGDEDAAYAVREHIAIEGTPAQPYMGPAWESEREDYVRRVRDALAGEGRK